MRGGGGGGGGGVRELLDFNVPSTAQGHLRTEREMGGGGG